MVRAESNKMTQNTILNAVTGYDISYENEVRIWRTIIQRVTVHPEHLLEFHIIDGSVIKHQMTKIAPRTNRMSKKTKERILQEYANRKKPSTIAREFNISINTVKSAIRRSNSPNPSSPKITCQNCGKEFFIRAVIAYMIKLICKMGILKAFSFLRLFIILTG